MKRVRLISLDGCQTFEADLQTDVDFIIYSNRVFRYSLQQGQIEHFREVPCERVRVIDVAHADNTSNPTTPKENTNEIDRH